MTITMNPSIPSLCIMYPVTFGYPVAVSMDHPVSFDYVLCILLPWITLHSLTMDQPVFFDYGSPCIQITMYTRQSSSKSLSFGQRVEHQIRRIAISFLPNLAFNRYPTVLIVHTDTNTGYRICNQYLKIKPEILSNFVNTHTDIHYIYTVRGYPEITLVTLVTII